VYLRACGRVATPRFRGIGGGEIVFKADREHITNLQITAGEVLSSAHHIAPGLFWGCWHIIRLGNRDLAQDGQHESTGCRHKRTRGKVHDHIEQVKSNV